MVPAAAAEPASTLGAVADDPGPRASPAVAPAVCRNPRRTRQVPYVSRKLFRAVAAPAGPDAASGATPDGLVSPMMDCAVPSPMMLVSPMMLSPMMLSSPMTLMESPMMLSALTRPASPMTLVSPMMLTSPVTAIGATPGAAVVSTQRDGAAGTRPVTNRLQLTRSARPDGRAGSPLAISSGWVAVSGLKPPAA